MKICEWDECSNEVVSKVQAARFCSLSCGQKYNVVRKCSIYFYNCAYCKKLKVTKDKTRKFCNHSCSASSTNIGVAKNFNGKNGTSTRPAKIWICLQKDCDKQLKTGKKYCSLKCGTKYRNDQLIEGWISGKISGTTESGLSFAIKKYLKIKADWRCQSPNCCVPGGWSVVHPSTGRVPVEVEHIDGNSSNNRPDNLIVLCPNCHSLTLTYKALNKGNGRHTRRVRYNEGKSY